jgi:kumamolisin
VTSVGGTILTTASRGGAWQSEVAWPGSGGGISPNGIVIPSWQTTVGVITATNGGSMIYRNGPDVAAEANTDNYICYNGTCGGGWGGTSFAAPRWAGYVALLNQTRAKRPVQDGFHQEHLSHWLSQNYGSAFDITRGTNGNPRRSRARPGHRMAVRIRA